MDNTQAVDALVALARRLGITTELIQALENKADDERSTRWETGWAQGDKDRRR